MADDQNTLKGKKAPNSLFEDIGHRQRIFKEGTAQERGAKLQLEEAKSLAELLEEGLASGPPKEIAKSIGQTLAKQYRTIDRLAPRVDLYKETRKERFVNGVALDIESFFEKQRASITTTSKSYATLSGAKNMLGIPSEELESRLSTIQGRIEAERLGAIGEIPNLLNPNTASSAQEKIDKFGQRTIKLTESAGRITAAMRMQRHLGLDPESRFQDIAKSAATAEEIVQINRAEASVKNQTGLGALSETDLKTREVAAANALVDAFKQLTDGSNKTTEKLKELEGQAEKAQKELKDINDVRKASGSGRGGRSGWDTATGIAGIIGMAGDAYKNIAVNQRMQEAANITGYASIENQKYSMYQAANQGDVASQLLLSQWGSGEEFGRSIKLRTGIGDAASGIGWGAAKMLGGKAAIAAGAAGTVGTAGIGAIPGAALATAGGAAVVSGGLDIATNISALARGTNTGQAYRAGVEADMEARRQIMAVSASQLQGLRDFGVGLGTAAIGMGGRGASFLDRTISKDNMQAMVNSRISPEQMAQMAQIGVQQIGSTFNENQIFAARGLERSGMGTMQENMQRMASLASAGVNNPKESLSGTLEAAVSKGMDSSKAISMMIDNTAQMAKSSFAAAAGLDVTSAASTVLAANIDKNGNQEYSAERAMTAQQFAKDITTNTDVSFSGMVNTSRISKKTGLGGDDAIFAAKLTTEELKTLQGKGDNEIKAFMLQKGINPNNSNLQPKELVNTLLDSSRSTLFEGRGAGFALGSAKLRESLTEKSKANVPYEKLSDEEKALLGKMGSGGNITGKEFYGTSLGIGAQNDPNAKTKVEGLVAGKGGTDQQKTLDDMRTQGFKQLSQAALEATSSFKTAADALKALGQMAKSVEDIGDQGGEGKFKTAAADAAGTFGESTMKFKDAVGAFAAAVRTMNTKSGIYKPDNLLERYQKDSDKSNKAGLKE